MLISCVSLVHPNVQCIVYKGTVNEVQCMGYDVRTYSGVNYARL